MQYWNLFKVTKKKSVTYQGCPAVVIGQQTWRAVTISARYRNVRRPNDEGTKRNNFSNFSTCSLLQISIFRKVRSLAAIWQNQKEVIWRGRVALLASCPSIKVHCQRLPQRLHVKLFWDQLCRRQAKCVHVRGRRLRVPPKNLDDIQTVHSADNLRKESSVARGSAEHWSSGYGSTAHVESTQNTII
jgi:hypothetical protein